MAGNNVSLLIGTRPESHICTPDYINLIEHDDATGVCPTRHHIIPYATLKEFFNTVITRSNPAELKELAKGVLHLIENAIDNIHNIDLVTSKDLKDAKDFADRMISGVINKNTLLTDDEKNPIITIHTLFVWMPGNIFIAPGDVRVSDPGNNFEYYSDDVVPHYESLYDLYKAMRAYITEEQDYNSFTEIINMITSLPDSATPYNREYWQVSVIKANALMIKTLPEPHITYPKTVNALTQSDDGNVQKISVNAKAFHFITFYMLQKFFNKVIIKSKERPDDLKKLAEGLLYLIEQAQLNDAKNKINLSAKSLDAAKTFVREIQEGNITSDTHLGKKEKTVIKTIHTLYLWMPGNTFIARKDTNTSSDPDDWLQQFSNSTSQWEVLSEVFDVMNAYICVGTEDSTNDIEMARIIELLKQLSDFVTIFDSALMIASCPPSHIATPTSIEMTQNGQKTSVSVSSHLIIAFDVLREFFNAVIRNSKVQPEQLKELARALKHFIDKTKQNYRNNQIETDVLNENDLDVAESFVARIQNGDITSNSVFTGEEEGVFTTVHSIFVWMPGNMYVARDADDDSLEFMAPHYEDLLKLRDAMTAYIRKDYEATYYNADRQLSFTDLINLLISIPNEVYCVPI